jgi:hypothetical protein
MFSEVTMSDQEISRVQLYEIKTIKKVMFCKCGNGSMVGNGTVKLCGDRYIHYHHCAECGVIEWFSDKYPLREEREVPITPTGVV